MCLKFRNRSSEVLCSFLEHLALEANGGTRSTLPCLCGTVGANFEGSMSGCPWLYLDRLPLHSLERKWLQHIPLRHPKAFLHQFPQQTFTFASRIYSSRYGWAIMTDGPCLIGWTTMEKTEPNSDTVYDCARYPPQSGSPQQLLFCMMQSGARNTDLSAKPCAIAKTGL